MYPAGQWQLYCGGGSSDIGWLIKVFQSFFLRNKSLVWEQLFRSWGGDPEAHGGGEARQDRPNGPYRQLREIQRRSCSSGYSLIIWSGTGGKILFGFNHKDNGKYILIFSETFQVCWYWPEPSWTWCDGLCSEVCPGIYTVWSQSKTWSMRAFLGAEAVRILPGCSSSWA